MQLDRIQQGPMEATLERRDDGSLMGRPGIMGMVACGDEVRPGDSISVELPPEPHTPREPV